MQVQSCLRGAATKVQATDNALKSQLLQVDLYTTSPHGPGRRGGGGRRPLGQLSASQVVARSNASQLNSNRPAQGLNKKAHGSTPQPRGPHASQPMENVDCPPTPTTKAAPSSPTNQF